MPPSGRVEYIDKVNEQLVDQTAQSQLATQLPNQAANMPKKTVTWQQDGTAVIT